MPSKKDPSKINLGAGLAGRNSVSITSVTFADDGTLIGQIRASEVLNETPLALSGDNVQEHINQLALNAPTLPNTLGQSTNSINVSTVDSNPASQEGFYFSGGAQAAHLVNVGTFRIEGTLFPADRGILVLEKDSVEIAALDLARIFVEGDPEDLVAPSRGVQQTDYTAEDNAVATVNALPQGFDVTNRFPVLSTYPGSQYEDYPQDYFAHQIATFSVEVTQTALTASSYVVKHYRSLKDYQAKGSVYGQSNVPTSGTEIFFDNVAASPSVVSVTSNPSSSTSAGSKEVSGVSVYDIATDTLPVVFTVNNMFDNSFLNEGIKIRKRPNQEEDEASLVYTSYDGGNPAPGQTASFNAYPGYQALLSEELQPQLAASNPYGSTTLQTTSTSDIVLAHGLAFETAGTVSPSRLSSEDFRDEATRYPASALTGILEPDGFGSSWNSSTALVSGQAQIRPATLSSDLTYVSGGELGYPTVDYTSGYLPSGNPNYSGITGTSLYYRALNLGNLKRSGKIRIVGTPVGASIWEDIKWDPLTNAAGGTNNGHQGGIRIGLSSGVGRDFLDLGRPYGEGGSLVSFSLENNSSVVVEFLLEDFPEKSPRGYYPVRLEVALFETVTTTALHKIELIAD